MSVFISWTGADRDVKNVICEKLRSENIPYWESDEHCLHDFSKDCIQNINRCKVFIVIVSDASMGPTYVINEVIAARKMENEGLANILVYKITDSPYTDQFSLQLNHISDANHVARIQKLGALGGVDTLVKRVKHLLELREKGAPEKPYDVLIPKLRGVPAVPYGYFVKDSRNDILEQIDNAFAQSNILILSNLFGFGKKSVIREHVKAHRYSAAVEVQGMHDSLYDFFLKDLQFTNITEKVFEGKSDRDVIHTKFEFLSKMDSSYIIVISDVDIEDEKDEYILALLDSLQCRVVFITQSSADAYRDHFPVLDVGRMEDAYLLDLFFHYYDPKQCADRARIIPALESFFDDIGGHTKTVEIAATVLSKEMRVDEKDLVEYLSAGADRGRTLSSRVVEKLSSLITMEQFSQDARRTLILIALSADPIIEQAELFKLMELCGITNRQALTELDNHRWVTYNTRTRSVYIEPILANVCIANLLEDYDIPTVLFDYMRGNPFDTLGARDAGSVLHYFEKMEHWLRLLQLNEPADVFKTARENITGNAPDIAKAESARAAFDDWYAALHQALEADPSPRNAFAHTVAVWLQYSIMPLLRLHSTAPALYRLNTVSGLPLENLDDILNEFYENIDDITFRDLEKLLGNSDDDQLSPEQKYLSLLISNTMLSFIDNDIDALGKNLEAVIDVLQSEPEYLEDSNSADALLIILKMLYTVCANTGAYQTGAAIFEKLAGLNLSGYHMHQYLFHYARLLIGCNDAGEDAVSILAAADDLIPEIMECSTLSLESRENTRREHLVFYAYALALEAQPDEAMEQLQQLLELGAGEYAAGAVDAIDAIINQLIFQQRQDEAVALIEQTRSFLLACTEDAEATEELKNRATALLALGEVYDQISANGFAGGGIVTEESYYQRYSRKVRNDPIAMMTYNRVAKGAGRFDFSGCSNDELATCAEKLRQRAKNGEAKMKLAPEAFALVSEAGYRTLGYRHHQVQYVGAAAMLDGKIAEILNGEGKTYTIPLVAFVNSLYCDHVFVLDSSQYLTGRNFKWMRGLYTLLGLPVGQLHPKTDYDDNHTVESNAVIYSDLPTFAFHVLYAQKRFDQTDLSKCCAIVDEADTILIENANKGYHVVSGTKSTDVLLLKCRKVYDLALTIKDDKRLCTVKNGQVQLTRSIYPEIEKIFDISYDNIQKSTELLSIEQLLRNAIRCLGMVKEQDYFVKNGEFMLENTSTGTLMPMGKEDSYFLARKHHLFLRPYEKALTEQMEITNLANVYEVLMYFGTLSGTSATASSFKKEFKSIYGLDVIAVSPALPVCRADNTITLYTKKAYKDAAIVELIRQKHEAEQPVLLIVKNTRESNHFCTLLAEQDIRHGVLNATNSEQSPELLANAGTPGSVLIATHLANRGVDIKLGGDAERMTLFQLVEQGVDVSRLDEILYTVPSPQIQETELYQHYHAALTKNRAYVQYNRNRVIQAGGLCVISAEPYGDLRIEQQIRGRAGRQGDVGESYIFESIDDTLFHYLPKYAQMKAMIQQLEDDVDIVGNSLLRHSVERFKETVHHEHFKTMQTAAEVAQRTKSSKDVLMAGENAVLTGEVTWDELLEMWCLDDKNQNEVNTILGGTAPQRKNGVKMLFELYPALFEEGLFETCYDYLRNAAQHHLEQRALQEEESRALLSGLLREKWREHIAAVQEVEKLYARTPMKNPGQFLAEAYEKDMSAKILEAVDLWLRWRKKSN